MTRLVYQQSAYGYGWGGDKPVATEQDAAMYRNALWLKMLSERHHRFIDAYTGEVVWFHASKIAPPVGSKHAEPYQ